MRRYIRLLFLLLLALALPLHAEEQATTLTAIEFVGNARTAEVVMLQEMSIHVGDPVDMALIERSRQAIMNLGLFKSVSAELVDGTLLRITVVERIYILPLPLLDVRPEGDYSYGAEVRFDNLMGLNQRLKITYEDKSSINQDIPRAKEAGLTYAYPRIVGTPYQLDFSTKLNRSEFNWPSDGAEQGHYRFDIWSSKIGASRWAVDDGEGRGWRYGGGLSQLIYNYELLHGIEGPYYDGRAISAYALLDYINVDDRAFYREGVAYGFLEEVGVPLLGSDFSFSREQFYYRSYRHLPSNGANINTQWKAGFANGCSFSCTAYALGGSSTLRGYAGDYVSGNIFALLNLEYHHPVSDYRQLRGVVFTDIGDAWAELESVTLNHLKSSVGVGLRWTVQSFVDLTLRFDYGYAIEAHTYRGYFSTRASF